MNLTCKTNTFLKIFTQKRVFSIFLTENHPWRNKTHIFYQFRGVSLFLQTHLKGLTLRNTRRQNLEIRASPKKKRRPLPTEKCHGEHRSDTGGWPSRFHMFCWSFAVGWRSMWTQNWLHHWKSIRNSYLLLQIILESYSPIIVVSGWSLVLSKGEWGLMNTHQYSSKNPDVFCFIPSFLHFFTIRTIQLLTFRKIWIAF